MNSSYRFISSSTQVNLHRFLVHAIVALAAVLALPVHAQQINFGDETQWIQSGVNTVDLFQGVESAQGVDDSNRVILPTKYELVEINMEIMDEVVKASREVIAEDERKVITLMFMPMSDGTTHQFNVWFDPIMHPDLAERYPEISTFRGISLTDPTMQIRMDRTPQGVHSIIFDGSATYYMDPYAVGNDEYYIVYDKKDFRPHPLKQRNEIGVLDLKHSHAPEGMVTAGEELHTYRLALACTGEYAQYHGGTVAGALAAMNTSMNRINGIYERELGVRMELIADNDLLIFLDGSTDPYTNSNGSAMLGQNQSTVSSIIGGANYDIGHVFSTGGGGIAMLGSVCDPSAKASGVTGQFAPIGDPFDVDYVAHEIGHQFGGQHTWNYCFGGFGSGIGYEPGSGSTIMAYAGLCGPDDMQSNSDDYFHVGNLQEMINFITTGGGSTCGVVTPSGNSEPTADAGEGGWTIPIETPFELTGVGVDADLDDVLSYCWEQYDLGPHITWTNPAGNSPLFRSFAPTDDPTRVFPTMNSLAFGNTSTGEVLPSYDRNMRFRFTVRDNHVGNAGGVAWDNVTLQVNSTGGPFFVTEPAGPSLVWEVGNWVPVTWEAGETMNSPFDCSTVSILLSTDGGLTYPTVLADELPNDGANYVFVPDMETNDARIKVKCNENVFFNINDQNFRIEKTGPPTGIGEPGKVLPITMFPNPASDVFYLNLGNTVELKGELSIRVFDALGRAMHVQLWSTMGSESSVAVNVADWAAGLYVVEVSDNSGVRFKRKLMMR